MGDPYVCQPRKINDAIRINDNTPDSGITDKGIDFADTVVAIVREVGEILEHLPCVKGLSGIILQFIKIRDEIQSNKKRCREIIDRVLRMSKSIYEILAEICARNGKRELTRLEYHLGICLSTLIVVYKALEKQRARRPITKLINRGLEELEMLNRRVDELNVRLSMDILIDIKLAQAVSTNQADHYPALEYSSSLKPDHILPPKPPFMVQRDAQFTAVLDLLLSEEPARIAILGSGGFGKSTLACSILHDTQIAARYKARYFLSCKNITNANTLLLALANMLGITSPPSNAFASVRRILATSPALLCLDNFETPWEPSDTREDVEGALASIADVPELSLIITTRGTQRPAQVAWSHPLLPPLSVLSPKSAWLILRNISPTHTMDEDTEKLLYAMEGIPLGITLISNLLRDGESARSLRKQWDKELTRAIENGGEGAQSNLNTSIVLSIRSPRMQKSPDATKLLAVLSLLPDGLLSDDDVLESLQYFLGINSIHKALQTLRAVALTKTDAPIPPLRIQVLSPIRLCCRQFLSSDISNVLEDIVDYYIDLLLPAGYGQDNPTMYAQIVPEIKNIHSVFQRAYTTASGDPQTVKLLLRSTSYLAEWSVYIGCPVEDTIHMALQLAKTSHLPISHADCLMLLGELYDWEGRSDMAEKCCKEAANIYQQEKYYIGEARALYLLGTLHVRSFQLEEAELELQRTLGLYRKVNNTEGEANTRRYLGRMHQAKGQLGEAEENLRAALNIYIQKSDLLGQANTYDDLCALYIQRGELDDAEHIANQSLEVARRANYFLGQGYALEHLGNLYLSTERFQEAISAFEQARPLVQKINNPLGELNIADALGAAYIMQDRVFAAEVLLTEAVKMPLDVIQKADILAGLGWAYLCGNRLQEAEEVLEEARKVYQRFGDEYGQADVLTELGAVYFKSGRLDEAERVLTSVVFFGTYSGIEMRRLWTLAEVYITKNLVDAAEVFLDLAMNFAKEQQSSYQQGNILRSIGILHTKRRKTALAIEAFEQALVFHKRAQWVSEQVTDLTLLGEARKSEGDMAQAEVAFNEAVALKETIRNI